MSNEETEAPASSPDSAIGDQEASSAEGHKSTSRLESRLATVEAQLQALQERVMELSAAASQAKTRALWSRIFLLGALLAAFFFMRSLKGG